MANPFFGPQKIEEKASEDVNFGYGVFTFHKTASYLSFEERR